VMKGCCAITAKLGIANSRIVHNRTIGMSRWGRNLSIALQIDDKSTINNTPPLGGGIPKTRKDTPRPIWQIKFIYYIYYYYSNLKFNRIFIVNPSYFYRIKYDENRLYIGLIKHF